MIRLLDIGLFVALTVLFVSLKLMGYSHWSWVWVLSPLWFSFLLYGAIVGGILYLGEKLNPGPDNYRRRR